MVDENRPFEGNHLPVTQSEGRRGKENKEEPISLWTLQTGRWCCSSRVDWNRVDVREAELLLRVMLSVRGDGERGRSV